LKCFIKIINKGDKKMIIYINGIKATADDLKRLDAEIKKGNATITEIKKTGKGATALTVEA
jgi:translation initiation factor 1 (eIF-1/SUI1)